MSNGFQNITFEEYEEFRCILQRHSYSFGDFALIEEVLPTKKRRSTEIPKGSVTVVCYSTKKKKSYPLDTGNPWTQYFEKDLAKGIFN